MVADPKIRPKKLQRPYWLPKLGAKVRELRLHLAFIRAVLSIQNPLPLNRNPWIANVSECGVSVTAFFGKSL